MVQDFSHQQNDHCFWHHPSQVPLSAAVQTGARCVQCLRNEVFFSDRWDRGGKINVSVDGGCVYINTNIHIINSRNQAYLYIHIYVSLCSNIFCIHAAMIF